MSKAIITTTPAKPAATRKATAPLVSTEVLPPEKQMSNVGHLPPGPLSNEAAIVAAIQHDLAACERHTRAAAFLAMRVGIALIWVRDNGSHGDLGPFIKQHFKAFSRSTLYNYITVADGFLAECKLKDKKTARLSNGEAVAPLLSEQLDLFIDAKAKHAGVIKSAVAWVNKRGLSQIYRDIAAARAEDLPPSRKGKKPDPKRPQEEIDRETALAYLTTLRDYRDGGTWQNLYTAELAELEADISKFNSDAAKLLKDRRDGKAKERKAAPVRKGKGAAQ